MFWLSLFMLLLLPTIPGHAQESGLSLAVEPASTPGEHTVSVSVQGMSPVYGADIRLAFDPNVLQVVDADEATPEIIEHGDFLEGNKLTAKNEANNQEGKATYAIALSHPAPPVQGDGVLAKITFRGLKSGQAAVELTQAQFGTQEGEVIEPALAAPVQFNVTQTETEEPVSSQPPTTNPAEEVAKGAVEGVVGERFPVEWLIAGGLAIVLVLLTLIVVVWRQLKRSQQAAAR